MKTLNLSGKNGQTIGARMPEADDVRNLKVGAVAPGCFGDSEVTEIYALQQDLHGAWFVCYYVRHGSNNGTMSESMKAGELIRDWALCRDFTSAEIDSIELRMRKANGITDGKCRADGAFTR